MKRQLLAACGILVILTISGALGLKTVSECDSDPGLTSPAELMPCYKSAAITMAYGGPAYKVQAMRICESIWTRFGRPLPDSDDTKKRAELTTNSCYVSVAKTLKDDDVCGNIEKRTGVQTALFGEGVTQDNCEEEVARLKSVDPAYYYSPNKDSLCSIVFILPLLLLAGFLCGKN